MHSQLQRAIKYIVLNTQDNNINKQSAISKSCDQKVLQSNHYTLLKHIMYNKKEIFTLYEIYIMT
jgi:hypothetical protein